MRSRLVIAVVLIAGSVVVAAPPTRASVPSAASSWSVMPTPSRPVPIGGTVKSVACPTATTCVAVGYFMDDSIQLPLVGTSNGGTWSFASAPTPTPSGFGPWGGLTSVACASATNCFGVGYYENAASKEIALIVRWNGKSWAAMPNSPPGLGSSLAGISCPTATTCFAVGSSRVAEGSNTLIERWNGAKKWGVLRSPSPKPRPTDPNFDELRSVSCVRATSCVAVGSVGDGRGAGVFSDLLPGTTLVERWNGNAWAVVKSPNRGRSQLMAVSCATSALCLAVGAYEAPTGGLHTLALRGNGATWTIVASPDGPTRRGSELRGVSCLSATNCVAFGASFGASGGTFSTLFERWNGSWSRVANLPGPVIATAPWISCRSASACVTSDFGLLQAWNGSSWAQVVTGGSSGYLASVSCTSPTQCFAVGDSYEFTYDSVTGKYTDRWRSLVERYDGTSWKIMASPDAPGSKYTFLADIECPASTSCFAVGSAASDVVRQPLVEHWDGTTWSIVANVPVPPDPDPNDGVDRVYLNGISCVSTTTCFAVGGRSGPTYAGDSPVIERWDGTAWSVVTGPAPAGITLRAISCTSASACVAVGSGLGTGSVIVQYDGTSWSVVPSPNPAGAQLSSVSCSTSTSCFATGNVIERWNGTTWSIVPWPLPVSTKSADLFGVACSTVSSCVAVGSYSRTDPDSDVRPTQTLVEQWDGARWAVVASANPVRAAFPNVRTSFALAGVSCAPVGGCTAVGGVYSQQANFTLAEHSP